MISSVIDADYSSFTIEPYESIAELQPLIIVPKISGRAIGDFRYKISVENIRIGGQKLLLVLQRLHLPFYRNLNGERNA